MTAAGEQPRPPSDQAQRDRILQDLDTTLLVEAGAGSGKTTSLVGRMLAHVARGTSVEQLAAVTFTRKAASELRERFEVELEKALARAEPGTPHHEQLRTAREQADRAFIGTIHSFAARLLREHPLEAGIDPSFEEVSEEEWPQLRRGFWNRWLARRRTSGSEMLEALRERGIDPRDLFEGFEARVRYPDVVFPVVDAPPPDCANCRRTLRALLARTQLAMPVTEPEKGWDALQVTVRRLRRLERVTDWERTADFCGALESLSASGCKVTQYKWPDRQVAKGLGEEWVDFVSGPAAALLSEWREHRYPYVMRALESAAQEFLDERLETGRLGFEDLLTQCVELLRNVPRVRRTLGERFRYLMVDEFQDTDPIQAELCFLLASDPEDGAEWRVVTPRPGALFVVGDPKQSIYRFRRADIQTYELVKQRIAASGAVLELTENFRSARPVERLVEEYFRRAFPETATPLQAAYAPLRTRLAPEGSDGIHVYPVTPDANNKPAIVAACSDSVASWLAERIEAGTAEPGDVMILAYNKASLHAYARALALRNIPAAVSGGSLPEEEELSELIVVLRTLADPANPVHVAAALEGLFFGCSPADLHDARAAGLEFSVAQPPAELESVVGRALARLHAWWIMSRRSQPDRIVERILEETGLLAFAAGEPVGDSRAGALLHLVDRLRGEGASATLAGAIEMVDTILASDTANASLLAGRTNAVRIMNLHKAKGLEARIVILAAPVAEGNHGVTCHVQREATGAATGGLQIVRHSGNQVQVMAQPCEWAAMEALEQQFLAAERERLLYVAATRAKRELWIARLDFQLKNGNAADQCIWKPLGDAAARVGQVRAMPRTAAPGRRPAAATMEEIRHAIASADARRVQASRATVRANTVTESAKTDRELRRSLDLPASGGRGRAWGSAVHRSIEAMGRGRRGVSLAAFVRAVLRDELPEASDVEVRREAARLLPLLEKLAATEEWQRAIEAGALLECPIMQVTREDGREQVLEGVGDAVTTDGTSWTVLDWKSDDVDAPTWAARLVTYERQVNMYATMLHAVAQQPAMGRIIRVNR